MAGSFFDQIKGIFGRATVALAVDQSSFPKSSVISHFKPLSKAGSSLPSDAARYVADGSNSSVIVTLQGRQANQAWNNRSRIYPPRDESKLFTRLDAWQIDQMHRLGEVIAVLEPISYDWGYFGTKKSPDWLRHVVTLWLGHGRKNQPLQTLVDLAELGGGKIQHSLDIILSRDTANYSATNSIERFDGVGEWLAENQGAIVESAPNLAADVRTELAAIIGRFGLHDLYLGFLLSTAIGSSKKARSSARQALTGADKTKLSALLSAEFAKSPPNARAELVEVAAGVLGDDARTLFKVLRKGEATAKVLAAFDRVATMVSSPSSSRADVDARHGKQDGPTGYLAVDGSWVELEPQAALVEPSPLPPEVLRVLEPAMDEFNALLAKGKAEAGRERWHWSKQFSKKDSGDLKVLAKLAESDAPMVAASYNNAIDWLRWHDLKHPAVHQFFHDDRLTLHHLVRFGVAMSNAHIFSLLGEWSGPAGAAIQHRLANGTDFRSFFAHWVRAGGNDFILGHLTERWYWGLPDLDTPIWPLLCDRFDQLDEALGIAPQSGNEQKQITPGLALLERFPKLPERYRGRLLLLAGDSSSNIRNRARALLQGTPDIGNAIAVQLQDGRQETRALAADWLAARGEKDQAKAIKAALKKEKSDLARAAMITALNRLGEDVSAYFDHATMVKEAQAGLAKPRPKGLDWFPFGMLPSLQWANGKAVDPILPQWWIVLAAKLKEPGGNALMNLWLDRLALGHAHKLGWMILTGWMDEDTRRPTDEEANAYANQHVDATLKQNISYAKRWPQSADYYPTDRATVFARLKRDKASQYLSTAVESKGMLALAARVNGADAAQRIRPFLKDHGSRTSQAKAVLDVLGSIGNSAALQLVLSAANRSKQRSVQAHAAALVEAIAERNGWSAAQLADRTVPTGGFDVDGTQELELGEARKYQLQFDAQDAVIILNADGREVKALPGHRVDDEKPIVDAAKKQLSNARKEVKQVLTAQNERLQEAMFLQRSWEKSEWESFIIGHPIVGRIASRLIWQGIDANGETTGLFRPLGDGSFTDANDGDVALDGFNTLRLAHSSLLGKEEITTWRKHLADYSVEPPFDQLGRELPVLSEDQGKQREIKDREGWMIETFKLRGIATKLGYQRGPAEDGGWFMTYLKTYREAGLVATIEFSGSPLPEENRAAALQSLCFRKFRGSGGGPQVSLSDVPTVLLAESWRDFHDIAEKGSGFDADWQKKVY